MLSGMADMDYFDFCTGHRMTSPRFDAAFGGPPRGREERVGQREMDERTVSLRHRRRGDEGSMSLDGFIERVEEEVVTRALDM